MDETLKALVEAAERGENAPHVQIALGSGLVSGLPIPHAEYVELQQQSIRVDTLKSQGPEIELWWAGAYDVEKAKGGAGFFVGGLFPLNLG